MAERGFILTIGIGDYLTSAMVPVSQTLALNDETIEEYGFKHFDFSPLGEDRIEGLKSQIRKLAHEARSQDLRAIAISCIGTTENENGEIFEIKRPGWPLRSKDNPYPIPLRSMIWEQGIEVPVFLFNDATCAAIAEFLHPENHDLLSKPSNIGFPPQSAFCFVRVGEGVNAGIMLDGQPWYGARHPEFGHVRPVLRYFDEKGRFAVEDRHVPHACKAHGDCFEGLIGGEALRQRQNLLGAGELRRIVTSYVAQMCVTLFMTVSPVRIAIGGRAARGDWLGIKEPLIDFSVLQGYFDALLGGQSEAYPVTREKEFKDFIYRAHTGLNGNLIGATKWTKGLIEQGYN